MAIKVKPLIQIVSTWGRRVGVSAEEYKAGINNPRADWATATSAAKDNYNTGIQTAIANDSFSKGVQKAGTSKWKDRTIAVGPQRWIQGVQAAGDAYFKGFEPFFNVISGLTLPSRGAAGSPQNYDRVRIIGDALHARKLQGGA